MARSMETEVVDTNETVRPEPDEKHDSSDAPTRKFSRWILLLILAIAATAVTFWWLHSKNFESTERRPG
jgi:multidrug resistance efflux pump